MKRQHGENPWVKTTCPYCGVGCGVEAKVGFNDSVMIRGDREHPANYGRLCSKGMALADTLVPDGRLLQPLIAGEQVSWDRALGAVADGFMAVIREYGPDAIAFYVSGQLLTEDYYVANKLMKGFIGSANIDTNSRLCMSSSVEGHKRAFGSDTVPGCYEDMELADLVVIVGSNMAWCHPVLFQRIKAAKERNPGMKIVVVDPRVTATCALADIHIALDPGTDVALFNGLLAYLAAHDRISRDYLAAHVAGGPEAIDAARRNYGDLALLAAQTEVEQTLLEQFYRLFAATEKVVTVYSQGVNQSIQGVDKVNSIINCHLATGRISKPGMGPFSVTGQPNAMGGREVGGMASALAAHMDIDNPQQRELVAKFWRTDRIPKSHGLRAVALFNGIAKGAIKAVWIMGTNPVVSMPDADKVKSALQGCPLVVVSDCIQRTDTSRYADILLPAAGWSEKSGSVTNSERRISRQRQFLAAAGEAKPDWWIICEVAKRMGYREGFSFRHEHEIFLEHARLSGFENNGQRCFDISGLADLSPQEYADLTPQQWPILAAGKAKGPVRHNRLFADGNFATQDKKARMIPLQNLQTADAPSRKYPLTLNTGRIRDQWHSMSRTGLSHRLSAHTSEPFLHIHPLDAQAYRLNAGGLARLESRWGAAILRVILSKAQKQGQLFMPIHWTENLSGRGKAGPLIGAFTDAISGQPELKTTSVRVKPIANSSEALIVTRRQIDLPELDYWTRQKISGGYAYHIASSQEPRLLASQLIRLLTASERQLYSFEDAGKSQYRFAVSGDDALCAGLIVAERIAVDEWEWLKLTLDQSKSLNGIEMIISGKPGEAFASGKMLCICKQLGVNNIREAIRNHHLVDVDGICEVTQAGTGCGSCLPELQMLLAL